MSKQDLEIYIHIPFCVKKCDYCDFLSFQQYNDSYVPTLIKEIETVKLEEKDSKDYLVKTIFIGGGTPSVLNGRDMIKILESVYQRFEINKNAEITIEANPGTLTKEKLEAYQTAGINRISMGLQSSNNRDLKELGRIHTYEEFLTSYELARKLGFSNINVDLMSAIPGQTREGWRQVLDTIIKLSPEHISAYSLIIEEGTRFYDRYHKDTTDLPSEDEERQMYYDTKHLLEESGYSRYEISNYCKEGYECRHNEGYWRRVDYIGFGLGASSFINKTRFSNIRNMKDYLDTVTNNVKHLHQDRVKLSNKEAMEEFMFLGLRMIQGVSVREFENSFQVGMKQIYGKCIDKLVSQKLLKINSDRICLTEKGLDLSNGVMAEFLL
jgi:oxygen-independent coproporphyrinogen-3 oxidase